MRSVASEAPQAQAVPPDRVSVMGTARWLVGAEGNADPFVILVHPSRTGRVEPRVKKRRPKRYPLMTKPRATLRKQLTDKKVAA